MEKTVAVILDELVAMERISGGGSEVMPGRQIFSWGEENDELACERAEIEGNDDSDEDRASEKLTAVLESR